MRLLQRIFSFLIFLLATASVFAFDRSPLINTSDLISAIDGASTELEKIRAVRFFLVSQSTEWVQFENCRLANHSSGRRRAQEPWSSKIFFLNLEDNPQSENAQRALQIFREFLKRPKEQRTLIEREKVNAEIDAIPLDPTPDCSIKPQPINYNLLTEDHLRVLVLARISLGQDIWNTYLKSYWTPRGRSEVYQKLISCQEEFKDLLGANLYCFTNLTRNLNSQMQNRALNYLQEAGLFSILLDHNPTRPCLRFLLPIYLENIESFNAASVFSPIHKVSDAMALHMRFACSF